MPRDGEYVEEPTLLSQMPLTPKVMQEREPEWWPALYNHSERRLAALRSWRWTWWRTWMQCAEFFLPRRAKAWVVANNFTRGNYLNDSIVDGVGSQAAEMCGAGMWSGLTNPARPWFRFEPAIENAEIDEDAKAWFEDTQKRVLTVLHQSNFYSTMAQFFQDVTVFGTSPMVINEDREDVIRCHLYCAGEYFLGVGAGNRVNTLYSEFTYTVLQVVEKWGLDRCPPVVRNYWAAGQVDTEVIVACAIEPNYAVGGGKDANKRIECLPTKFAFRQTYWLRGQKTARPLEVRGFYDQPFMAGRWSIVSNDAYGRGPGMSALGDQKQVQQETNRKAEFIEKGVRPPMIADSDMKNEPASVMPGMVTFVNTANGKKGFVPAFEVNAVWLQHLVVDIKDVEQRIKDCFYIPQFMAITQMQGVQPRNELELTKRDLERLQVLGPVINLFEDDVASPALQRIISIMQRRGMLRPLPPSLQSVPLKISYQSMMRIAQQSAESVSLKDFAQSVGVASLAAKNAGVPDPARKVNWDKWTDHIASSSHVPSDILFTDKEVATHDKARADAEAQVQQQQMASEMSKPAVDAARVLSETDVAGGSYLSSLLSGNTVPQ